MEDKPVSVGFLRRRSLNLLWTVPLAFFIGYVPAALAGFERCGIRRCAGDPGGFESPSASSIVNAAIFAGVMMFAALALTPWLRPVWVRLLIAAVVAGLLAIFWMWTLLFTD